MRLTRERRVVALRAGALLVILAGWEALARLGVGLREFLPPLEELAAALVRVLTDSDLPLHARVTLTELGLGVLVGSVLGVSCGMVLALGNGARLVMEPLLLYVGAVPKIVLYPIFLWFLKVGIESKIGMAALSVFFPVVIQTLTASWSVRPIWVDAARLLRAGAIQRVRYVYLPAMAPTIFTGLRLGVAAGIVGTLMAETKMAGEGIGYLVMFYYGRYRIPEMYSVLIVVFAFASVVAVSMNAAGRWLRLRDEGDAQEQLAL